ncbi:MAG: MATE family efflux transporter [Oscillospiraceae bacterium]|nr:MATE family efflux transporter [Oscillospiraceae bacterium]
MRSQITEGPIWKPLLAFFFPILLGTFFQQLYNTVDAVIVGNFVGTRALAAVGGSSALIINFLINMFVGVASGATVIIAQQYGAKELTELRRTVHTAAALSLAAGAGITVLGIVLAEPALALLGTPEDIMEYSVTYLRVYFAGTLASFTYNVGSGILRAVGDSRRPLYFLIAACMVNIVLDLLFVVVLDLEVFGVAVATVLAQVAAAALVLAALTRPEAPYYLHFPEIRFHRDILKRVLMIGIPAGIQSDMYTISNMLIQSQINAFGTGVVAAWTAFGKMDGFYWMTCGAFGVAITTFVSQNFGAKKYDRLRRSVKVCLAMTMGATIAISALFCACGPWLLRMFTQDLDVLALGQRIVWFICPFYASFVCIEILSGTCRGTGDSLKPTLITCGGVCALRVLWVILVLPCFYSVDTILVSYPVSWTITSLLFIVYYLRGNWLRRRIAKNGGEPEKSWPPPADKAGA